MFSSPPNKKKHPGKSSTFKTNAWKLQVTSSRTTSTPLWKLQVTSSRTTSTPLWKLQVTLSRTSSTPHQKDREQAQHRPFKVDNNPHNSQFHFKLSRINLLIMCEDNSMFRLFPRT
jgi:hypothetical protein